MTRGGGSICPLVLSSNVTLDNIGDDGDDDDDDAAAVGVLCWAASSFMIIRSTLFVAEPVQSGMPQRPQRVDSIKPLIAN